MADFLTPPMSDREIPRFYQELCRMVNKYVEPDSQSYSTFAIAVADIDTTETTFVISDSQAVTANITVPSTLALSFLQGGDLNISAGVTVTINGYVEAGPYQIFTGDGAVSFGSGTVGEVYSEWWGAIADDSTDCTTAINSAISSGSQIIKLINGTYIVSSINATGKNGLVIRGVGVERTTIKGTTADKNIIDLTASRKCRLCDFYIEGDSTNVPKIGILMARNSGAGVASRHYLDNIDTGGNFSVAAIYNFASEKPTLINCIIRNNANSATCYKAAPDNPDSITSDFQTILPGSSSTTSHNFINSTFWYYGTSGYSLWLDTCHNTTITGGAITTPGITSDIGLYIKDSNMLSARGTRFESTANTCQIRFAGTCGYIDLTNCHIGHATNSIDAEASTTLSYVNIKSQILEAGNTIDLSNAQILFSYIDYGTKSLKIGAGSSDCTFEGTQANFTDGAGSERIFVIGSSKTYWYGVPAVYHEAVDTSVLPLVKLHGAANSDYVEIQDSGGVSRHQFAASGYVSHIMAAAAGREVMCLNQNDQDKSFVNYEGTSEAGATKNISSWKSGGSVQGFVKTEINGAAYWVPYYSAPASADAITYTDVDTFTEEHTPTGIHASPIVSSDRGLVLSIADGEDLENDYIELDANSTMSISDDTITYTETTRDEISRVYKDFGANYFDGDFVHYIDVKTTAHSNPGLIICWGMANSVKNAKAWVTDSDNYFHVRFQYATGHKITLEEGLNGSYYTDTYSATVDTWYYLKIVRDESVGDYGTLSCFIYSDSDRTTELDELSLTLHSSKKDFRYLYAFNSYDDNHPTYLLSGEITNLVVSSDLNVSETTFTIAESIAVTYDVTVPSNTTLKFLQGGMLDISAGVTVTINGSVEAGPYEIFTGDGTVILGRGYNLGITRDNSDNTTDGTGEDDLASHSITAGLLSSNGGIKIKAAGTISGANDAKTIKLHFGASSWTIISAAAGDETDWIVNAEAYNTATNAQRIRWQGIESDGTLTTGYETAAIDTTAAVTLKFTGECANASDTITQTMFQVNLE